MVYSFNEKGTPCPNGTEDVPLGWLNYEFYSVNPAIDHKSFDSEEIEPGIALLRWMAMLVFLFRRVLAAIPRYQSES